MPDRPTALLDANVLWSPQQRNLILQIAVAGIISARWTEQIEPEWLGNTDESLRSRVMSGTIPLLRKHFPGAWVVGLDPSLTYGSTDIKDGHVAAAAEKVAPSVLVTWNLRDFDRTYLSTLGIEVQTPDTISA